MIGRICENSVGIYRQSDGNITTPSAYRVQYMYRGRIGCKVCVFLTLTLSMCLLSLKRLIQFSSSSLAILSSSEVDGGLPPGVFNIFLATL